MRRPPTEGPAESRPEPSIWERSWNVDGCLEGCRCLGLILWPALLAAVLAWRWSSGPLRTLWTVLAAAVTLLLVVVVVVAWARRPRR